MRRKQRPRKKHLQSADSDLSLLARLKEVSPFQFEHLTYDLLVLSGLRNAVWRTPGPDAGRDIEGEVITSDMSESVVVQRWYIECKRYNTSLDWPTVYGKVAYAHNHGADYLLFVTTGTLSPRCREEISKRDMTRERPIVRVWDGPLLDIMVPRHPLLLVKYGLTKEQQLLAESMLPLVTLTSKVVQAAYGKASLHNPVDPTLEFSAALVDLISARIAGTYSWGRAAARRTVPQRDLYSWVKIKNNIKLEACDSYGLRALLSAARFFSGAREIIVSKSTNGLCQLHMGSGAKLQTVREALAPLALWSNLELRFAPEAIVVSLRQEDGYGGSAFN